MYIYVRVCVFVCVHLCIYACVWQREGVAKTSVMTQQLGSRNFFKFDPVKGSFYKYSPDIGVTAKAGSIADTLAKVCFYQGSFVGI